MREFFCMVQDSSRKGRVVRRKVRDDARGEMGRGGQASAVGGRVGRIKTAVGMQISAKIDAVDTCGGK